MLFILFIPRLHLYSDKHMQIYIYIEHIYKYHKEDDNIEEDCRYEH